MRSERALLQDILTAADRIARFVTGMDLEQFLVDERTQSAVLREIMVIGEAASQMPGSVKAEHPDVPWQDLVQLRNFYVHVYHGVNYRRVWSASTRRMPLIRTQVAAALKAAIGSEREGGTA